MHRKAARMSRWLGCLALCAGTALSAVIADPAADRGTAMPGEVAADTVLETLPQPAINKLSDVDLLERHPSADVYPWTDPFLQNSFISSGAHSTSRPPAPDPVASAEPARISHPQSTPERSKHDAPDFAPPRIKVAALVLTIVLGLLLVASILIGFKLRGHHQARRSTHRFIAYDLDRQ